MLFYGVAINLLPSVGLVKNLQTKTKAQKKLDGS